MIYAIILAVVFLFAFIRILLIRKKAFRLRRRLFQIPKSPKCTQCGHILHTVYNESAYGFYGNPFPIRPACSKKEISAAAFIRLASSAFGSAGVLSVSFARFEITRVCAIIKIHTIKKGGIFDETSSDHGL